MGCSNFPKQKRVAAPSQPSQPDPNLLPKIPELGSQLKGVPSSAEFELIHQTFLSLQDIDMGRRNIWLQALHNDVLAPLYFSNLENFKFSQTNPFLINESIFTQLQDKDFDSIKRPKEELRECLLSIFWSQVERFSIDLAKIQRFILAVSENYQDNPFHNFFHAFSVCQMVFTISELNSQFDSYLLPIENLALLVSALGHDLNHPGVTNIFMINSRHPLAIRYNDLSVLENHHAATLVRFLELPGLDIFSSLSGTQQSELRKIIIHTVLATDMAKHSFVMEHFCSCAREFDKGIDEHRQAFIDLVMHAADIGNPVLKFELATVWSLRIIQEFNEQVWKEEQKGIPVSEFMRIGSDLTKIKRNQIGFIDVYIQPLWMLLGKHLKGLGRYLESIEENRKSWENIESI